jgi:hypothetical protein
MTAARLILPLAAVGALAAWLLLGATDADLDHRGDRQPAVPAAARPEARGGVVERQDLVTPGRAPSGAPELLPLLGGLVHDASNGRGLAGARLEALAFGRDLVGASVSGSEGGFLIDGDPQAASALQLRVRAAGYLPVEVRVDGLPHLDLRIGVIPEGEAASLTGRLVDVDGAAVGGVRAIVEQQEVAPEGEGRRFRAEVLSGADGTFWLGGLPPGSSGLHLLSAEHAVHRRNLELPPRSTTDLGAIVLERFDWVSLVGVLRDPDGAPIDGAELRVVSDRHEARSVTTAADGSFRIGRLPPGPMLLPVTAGSSWRLFEVDLPRVREHRVELGMPRGRHGVAGRVQSGGQPVAGLRIDARLDGDRRGQQFTRTGADGGFRIDGLPPGELVLQLIRQDPWQSRTFEGVELDRDDLLLEFPPLPAPVTIHGSVRDGAGVPLAGVSLRAGDRRSPSARTRSAADGRYELRVLVGDDREAELAGSLEGHLPVGTVVPVPIRVDRIEQDLVLERIGATGTVRGAIRDAAGRPQPEAWCVVAMPGTGDGVLIPSVSEVSDSVGRFRCERVPVGVGELRVLVEGRPSHAVPLVVREGEATELAIDLPALERGKLTVLVRDGSGAPFEGAHVVAFDREGAPLGSATTEAEGRAILADLPRVPIRLTVGMAGSLATEVEVEPAQVGGVPVAVVVPAGPHRIEGSVREGAAQVRAWIRARGVAAGGPRFHASVLVGEDGRFVLAGLPEGRLWLRAERRGQVSAELEVAVPGPPVDLQLGTR